jgi:alpha-galactosidase
MTVMRPILVLLALAATLPAQPPVEYSAAKKIWLLRTDSSTLALGVNPRGELENLYWGAPLWRTDDIAPATGGRELSSFDPAQSLINEEYLGWGGTRYSEPSVKITRADGVRDLVLHYSSHAIEADTLKITLKDIKDDIFVNLNYKVYPREGIVRKSATLENRSNQAIKVESMHSGVVPAPPSRNAVEWNS